jgi:sortase B
MKTRKIMSLILISAICLSLLACGKTEIEEEPIDEEITPAVTEEPAPEPPPERKYHLEWWEKNNEVVGWVEVADRIAEPVLQREGCNDFWLDHNFDGEPSASGSIGADYKNSFDGFNISDNTLLYGHNMMAGTFFAPLSNYYTTTLNGSLSFYKSNPVVRFDTLYEKMEWKVFAVVLYNVEEEYGNVTRFWDHIDFDSEDKFHDYILDVMDRSVLFTDVDIEYGDKILSVMTCYYSLGTDSRLVVHARRIRPGESRDVDVDKASLNRFDFRMRPGEEWIGERVWDSSYLTSYTPPRTARNTTASTTARN